MSLSLSDRHCGGTSYCSDWSGSDGNELFGTLITSGRQSIPTYTMSVCMFNLGFRVPNNELISDLCIESGNKTCGYVIVFKTCNYFENLFPIYFLPFKPKMVGKLHKPICTYLPQVGKLYFISGYNYTIRLRKEKKRITNNNQNNRDNKIFTYYNFL